MATCTPNLPVPVRVGLGESQRREVEGAGEATRGLAGGGGVSGVVGGLAWTCSRGTRLRARHGPQGCPLGPRNHKSCFSSGHPRGALQAGVSRGCGLTPSVPLGGPRFLRAEPAPLLPHQHHHRHRRRARRAVGPFVPGWGWGSGSQWDLEDHPHSLWPTEAPPTPT